MKTNCLNQSVNKICGSGKHHAHNKLSLLRSMSLHFTALIVTLLNTIYVYSDELPKPIFKITQGQGVGVCKDYLQRLQLTELIMRVNGSIVSVGEALWRNVHWLLRLTAALIAIVLMPVSVLASNNEPAITLETGGGEAGCWVSYKLDIFKDGKVHWHGLSYVHVKGHRYKWIGKKKVDALLKKFDDAQFFEITNSITEQREARKTILAKIKEPGFVPPPEGSPERAEMDRAFMIKMDGPQVFDMTLNTGGRKKTLPYFKGDKDELEGAILQAIPGSKNWWFPASDPSQSHCKEDH